MFLQRSLQEKHRLRAWGMLERCMKHVILCDIRGKTPAGRGKGRSNNEAGSSEKYIRIAGKQIGSQEAEIGR
jgi:hypothetical protein